MARNTYTPEFKAKVVLEILKEERTVEQIASEKYLNPNMLRTWKREFLERASSVFEDSEKKEKEMKRKEAALLNTKETAVDSGGLEEVARRRDGRRICLQIHYIE